MAARDDRMRDRIDAKRRADVLKDLACSGDTEAIKQTFFNEYGVLTKKPEHMAEVVRRVDERLKQGEDNVYGLYADVAQDFMDEINPRKKSEEEQRREVLEEMSSMRPSNPNRDFME